MYSQLPAVPLEAILTTGEPVSPDHLESQGVHGLQIKLERLGCICLTR